MGYSFQSTEKDILYALSHRQDNTYHNFVTTVMKHWFEWGKNNDNPPRWFDLATKAPQTSTLLIELIPAPLLGRPPFTILRWLLHTGLTDPQATTNISRDPIIFLF